MRRADDALGRQVFPDPAELVASSGDVPDPVGEAGLRPRPFLVQKHADRVLLLMPHTDLAGSLIVARRICERVARATLQAGERVVHPTISVGVAAGEPGREYGFSDLVRQAQDGLTAASARGGNRVEYVSATAELSELPTAEIPIIPPLPPRA